MNFDSTEDDIRNYFSQCGEITEIKLLMRHDGKSKGRGFVKFGSPGAQDKALRLNGTQFMGRSIRVEVPKNRSYSNQSKP